jgi:hypothetical protein
VPTRLLKMYNMLSGLASTCFRAEHIVLEHWFIPWDPGYDLVQHFLRPTKPWLLLRVSGAVGISSRHHQMGEFACLAVTCELHYSISVVDKLLCLWSESMSKMLLGISGVLSHLVHMSDRSGGLHC